MASRLIETDALTRAGFTVGARSASELSLARGAERLVAHLVRQPSSPTARQIEETQRLPSGEVALFVVPRATKRVRELIARAPRAWLITHDGAVVLDAAPAAAAEHRHGRGRVPWGRYALLRALLRDPEPRTQLQLAAETGLTQGAVSGALRKLDDLARSHRAGWSAATPEAVWEAFMSEYPGAQGVRTHWYSRAPFAQQCKLLRAQVTLSADAAADAIAPWRQPVQIIAYAAEPVDMEALGFSPATAAEASVAVVMPADRTVFATAAAWEFGVADPVLTAWDLRDVGGNDAAEAIARLRSVVLSRFAA